MRVAVYGMYPMSLNSYKKYKIKMLKKDFQIQLTAEECDYINQQVNEHGVDRCCRAILTKYLK